MSSPPWCISATDNKTDALTANYTSPLICRSSVPRSIYSIDDAAMIFNSTEGEGYSLYSTDGL